MKGRRQKRGEGWGGGGVPEASDPKPRGGNPPPGETEPPLESPSKEAPLGWAGPRKETQVVPLDLSILLGFHLAGKTQRKRGSNAEHSH